MKQSIYRFRQAEVTVMRRMVASIRVANQIEANEKRMDLHTRRAWSRPSPRGAGGESGSFISAADYSRDEKSAPYDYVSYAIDDSGLAIDDDTIAERAEGHIQLRTNFRTAPGLLQTLNNMFDDTFDPRHHQFPGDFHATAQPLESGRETERMEQSSGFFRPKTIRVNYHLIYTRVQLVRCRKCQSPSFGT